MATTDSGVDMMWFMLAGIARRNFLIYILYNIINMQCCFPSNTSGLIY